MAGFASYGTIGWERSAACVLMDIDDVEGKSTYIDTCTVCFPSLRHVVDACIIRRYANRVRPVWQLCIGTPYRVYGPGTRTGEVPSCGWSSVCCLVTVNRVAYASPAPPFSDSGHEYVTCDTTMTYIPIPKIRTKNLASMFDRSTSVHRRPAGPACHQTRGSLLQSARLFKPSKYTFWEPASLS